MITREDIREFFTIEIVESANKDQEFEKLSLDEQIQIGKAIKDISLDREYKDKVDDEEIRLLHLKDNLSEFRIGDTVVLRTEQGNSYICECRIYDLKENGDIEISINPYNFSSSIDDYYNEKLILVKAKVLMQNFYWDFCYTPKFFAKDYFENHIINTIPPIEYQGHLEETKKNNKDAFKNIFDIELNNAQLDAFSRLELANNYFLIQGPPGTGKSFLLAAHLIDCIMNKKKVVVVAPTHMAVNNLLMKIVELYSKIIDLEELKWLIEKALILKCGQSHNAKNLTFSVGDTTIKIQNRQYLNVPFLNDWDEQWKDSSGNKIEAPFGCVIGMTPYALQSRRAKGLEFDELIIDEAGQMTIPIAWMALVDYKKILLAGDHKQLPPIISQDLQSEELKHSIFEHLIRPYNSLMLNVSFRMNDEICNLVSDLFYEGKLKSFNPGRRLKLSMSEPLYSSEKPVVFVNCEEYGKQFSHREAEKAIEIVVNYINNGIKAEDIAVLAPFRAQCALIRKLLMKYLTKEIRDNIVVDTVDRMQGQEREIIIYSFTSGDVEYMKQMSDFLYNPNKLNVAFSRAKNKLIILGNTKSLGNIDNELLNKLLNRESILKL